MRINLLILACLSAATVVFAQSPNPVHTVYSVNTGPFKDPGYFLFTGYTCVGVPGVWYEPLSTSQLATIGNFGPYTRVDGQWVPQSRTISGYLSVPGGPLEYSTTSISINADGIITYAVSNDPTSYYGANGVQPQTFGVDNWIFTLDVNTGEFNSHQNAYYNITAASFTQCPSLESFVYSSYIENDQATIPVTLTPLVPTATLSIVDPSQVNGSVLPLASNVDPSVVPNAPPVTGLSADGNSAAVVLYQSNSDGQVTLSLSGTTGSLTQYDPSYLVDGPQTGTSTIQVSPISPCSGGPCVYLALIWASGTLTNGSPEAIEVEANQAATSTLSATSLSTSVNILPPPVVLVHGIWSSPADWAPFSAWLAQNYPQNLIFSADYGAFNSLAFSDSQVQAALTSEIRIAITSAAGQGIVARKVDIVAHSMGGLVARYLMENGPQSPYVRSDLPANPIHKLITVATPQSGSPLASQLLNHQNDSISSNASGGSVLLASEICNGFRLTKCTLGSILQAFQKPVGPGVSSLVSGLPASIEPHSAIVGIAPTGSSTQAVLDLLIGAFAPGETVSSMLGVSNDTIVSADSQSAGAVTGNGTPDLVTVNGVVHAPFCVESAEALIYIPLCTEPAETKDLAVWTQVLNSLRGQTLSGAVSAGATPEPAPVFDLTGYTQVPTTNVTILPANNSKLTLGTPTAITATSSAKKLAETFAFQNVVNSSDASLLYSTQAPFSMTLTPARLGAVDLVLFAVFTDKTYATIPLNYTISTTASVLDVRLPNPPVASLKLPQTIVVDAVADYPTQTIDVTSAGVYTARSKTAKVFSVGATGTITTTGSGVDWLDVTYGGQTGSALVTVGECTFTLSPTNQLTNFTGGTSVVQVVTQPGCSWVAVSDSSWLSLSNPGGTGSGTIQAIASANTSGSVRFAHIRVGNTSVAIMQPITSCTYSVTPTALALPPSGGQGSLSVVTSCPIISSSNQTWADAVTLNSNSVEYVVDPNTTTQLRTATLTIGTQKVQLTEGGGLIPLIGISPTLLAFPSQVVGTTSQALAATVSNSGTAAMTISGVQLTGAGASAFNLNNGCGTSLAAGASCVVSAAFKPTATGSESATILISDNAAASPQSISLTGISLPAPDFSVSASPTSLTIKQGQTGSATISVVPTAGYNQFVSLTCGGLPSGASCNFSPSGLTPAGGVISSQLTIQTTSPLSAAKSNGPLQNRGAPTILLGAFVGLGFLVRRRKIVLKMMTSLAISAVLLGLGGCGSGTSTAAAGTPKGTYSVILTASGGASTTHTVAISLSVD